MYKPGELHHATVNGRAAIIYLTMSAVEIVDDEILPRFQLGPNEPIPHAMISLSDALVIGDRVQPFTPVPEGIMRKGISSPHHSICEP